MGVCLLFLLCNFHMRSTDYLMCIQRWPRSLSPYDITRQQLVERAIWRLRTCQNSWLHMYTKFNYDTFVRFSVITKNVHVLFIKEQRGATLRSPCDVMDDVIIMKITFSCIICHADLRSEVGLTLSLKLTKIEISYFIFKIRPTSELFYLAQYSKSNTWVLWPLV